MGLANSNLGAYQTAIPYFYAGMNYAHQPPFDKRYLVASKPHHLYGNLAEAYYKLQQYDSAQRNALISMNYANEIQSHRGVMVAKNLLGLIMTQKGQFDSAMFYEQMAYQEGIEHNEKDISLISLAAIARIMVLKKNYTKATYWLEEGFKLKEHHADINYYFTKQFLDEALAIFTITGNETGKLTCLSWSVQNNERINQVTDQQIIKIIQNGIRSENRANQLALQESENKRHLITMRLIMVLLAGVALGVIFILYYLYNKKQLKEISLRQEISRDLHDDINATLSSIKLYSELAIQEQQKQSVHAIGITKRITDLSASLMGRVSDVIYLLKQESNTETAFVERIKLVSQEILRSKDIQPIVEIQTNAISKMSNPLLQKNILLILKEALNNTIKYSGASTCTIRIKLEPAVFVLEIEDNGKGMPQVEQKGNGLLNMKHRCEQLKGNFSIKHAANSGVIIRCAWPIS